MKTNLYHYVHENINQEVKIPFRESSMCYTNLRYSILDRNKQLLFFIEHKSAFQVLFGSFMCKNPNRISIGKKSFL